MLEFKGQITTGVGRYSNMVIPGREELPEAPADWPTKLCPGSFNVVIDEYPKGFTPPAGRSGGVYKLDDGSYAPEFVIPGQLIVNNGLKYNGEPASAQVWRARLHVVSRSEDIDCWVLRRFGSNVGSGGIPGNVLEIVSEDHLRNLHDLHEDGEPVVVVLIEGGF